MRKYTAHVSYSYRSAVTLGPCDTRDAAARLATAWIAAHKPAGGSPGVGSVTIDAVEIDEDEE